MLSNVISEDTQKSSVPETVVSVLISNYPLANGGYLVSFGKDDPDESFVRYDPVSSLDFEASKLSTYLDYSSIFLPKGCYYLSDMELAGFIKALSFGASTFGMKLVPASSQMQGLIVVRLMKKVCRSMSRKKKTRGNGGKRIVVRPLGGKVL